MYLQLAMALALGFSTVTAQTLIRIGLKRVGPIEFGGFLQVFRFLQGVLAQPYILAGIFLQGIGLLWWLALLSRIKLGLAFGLSGGCVFILSALSSGWVLKEPLSLREWFGIIIIVAGVTLLSLRSA